MSKIIKKPYKLSEGIKSLVIATKKANKTIGCRSLAEHLFSKCHIKISKSSINKIIREAKLSRTVGRPVSRSFRNSAASKWAGYVFLLGADRLLKFSAKIAEIFCKIHPEIHHKFETMETVCQALILSKAFFNVPLEKMMEYNKEELWQLLGKKVNKRLLKQFVEQFNNLQPIKEQLVRELSTCFQDVHCIKIVLQDDSSYFFDGQLKSIWLNRDVPVDFCITHDSAMDYIKNYIDSDAPWLIFDAPSGEALAHIFSLFILSFEKSEANVYVKNMHFIGIKGDVIFSYEPVHWKGKNFIIGVDPAQHRLVSEFSREVQWQKENLQEIGQELFYSEKTVIFPQHIVDKNVMIRLIIVKGKEGDFTQRGIFTNLDANEWDTPSVIKAYVKKCPDFEKSPVLYQNIKKTPIYVEDFLSMEKIYLRLQKIHNCAQLEDVLTIFVDILDLFVKRSFFGQSCQGWSLLKMRELFFKQDGYIQRDLSDFIVYKLFGSNMLRDKTLLIEAVLKFNEQPVADADGRKFWLEIS